MTSRRLITIGVAVLGLLLGACEDDDRVAEAPPPRDLTREAIGHYCNMIVVDHLGPKGQIFVKGVATPVWFTSVRDTIAFTMLPGEAKNLAAIYVNDMGRASWDSPEPDTWIDAKGAWYVIGSDRVGGMGAPEAVPFGDKPAAEAFTHEHGGRVVAFADIPTDYILGGVAEGEDAAGHGHGMHGTGQAAGMGEHAEESAQ